MQHQATVTPPAPSSCVLFGDRSAFSAIVDHDGERGAECLTIDTSHFDLGPVCATRGS